MTITIERLTKNDAGAAAGIVEMFHGKSTDSVRMQEWLSDSRNFLLAAHSDGAVAGFLLAYELDRVDQAKTMMFLYKLDVLEKYRRKGIGKSLILELKRWCVQNKCLKMFVITNETNSAAINLYESAGGKRKHNDDALFEYHSF